MVGNLRTEATPSVLTIPKKLGTSLEVPEASPSRIPVLAVPKKLGLLGTSRKLFLEHSGQEF